MHNKIYFGHYFDAISTSGLATIQEISSIASRKWRWYSIEIEENIETEDNFID